MCRPRFARGDALRLLALGALLGLGCSPSQFDGLSGGRDGMQAASSEDAGQDAEVEEAGASVPDAAGDELDGGMDGNLVMPDDATLLGDAHEASFVNEASAGDGSADAGDAQVGCPEGGPARALRASVVTEFTRLKPPSAVKTRVLGPSAWLGSKRTWLFGKTILTTPEAMPPAARPDNFPSFARDGASQPWLSPTPTPNWQLQESLEASGTPKLLLPLAAAEQGMYVSLFPISLIRDPQRERGGLAFLFKSPGFFQPSNEVWIARLDDSGDTALRNSEALFKAGDPLFGLAAHVGETYVKLLACTFKAASGTQPQSWPCVVARAPLAGVMQRSAYEVYVVDAQGVGTWSAQFSRATPVLSASDTSASLSWNPYLNKFLIVHGIGFDNKVVLQAAPAVEGPWSERVELPLPKPAMSANLETREHPSIAQRCGQRIFISYWSPTEVQDGWPTAGEVVLSTIDLQ